MKPAPACLISIGRSSDNTMFRPDICSLPHLFLSYSEPQQLIRYLLQTVQQVQEQGPVLFAAVLSAQVWEQVQATTPTDFWQPLFIRNNPDPAAAGSRHLFLQQLQKELRRRRRRTRPMPLLFVLIDDVLDLVITRRRSTGLQFLQLLIEGPACGMHVIAASGRAYRNLMLQLLNLNPAVKEKLKKQMPGIDFSVHYPLGAELVMTPEDVCFFRKRNEPDYTRFFPI